MSWVLRQFVVIVFAAALLGVDAFAQEKKITYGAESDFNSRFVWREMVLDKRPVSENEVWLDAYGVNLSVWSNVALSPAADRSRLRSSGLSVSYKRNWKKFTLEPEIEVYSWQDDPGSTNTMECSVRLEYQTGFVHIFSEHAVDVIANKGGYFGEGGLRFEKQAGKKTKGALELASGFASTKFNDFNIDVAKPALNFLRAEIAVTHHFNPHLYVRPHFDFVHLPDHRIREALGVRNIGTFGVAVGFKF
jgi:hypothetical protein